MSTTVSLSCMPAVDLRCLIIFLLLFCSCTLSATPSAVSIPPSPTWYGDDGSWSAISISIGSPHQLVDVFVSTASSETVAVSENGCDNSSICKSKRGGFFDFNKSSTFQYEGFFELGLDEQLGFTGYGLYGLDVVEFGTIGLGLQNTIVGSINTTEYLLGYFGLGNIPGNFTNAELVSPLSGLVQSEYIPSHSYGYTAGASYQQKGDPCSLTLGGYDTNRFTAHNISFQLNPQQQPEAFLNSISISSSYSFETAQNWSSNPLELLASTEGIYVTIDSSTPFLWLPKSICETFANALGLTYNDSLSLYTYDRNASQRDALRSQSPTFTLSLSDTSQPSQIVNISLPYAAFDLQLSYPYIPNTSYEDPNKYYFPLRQAANETQYTLGRAFLQEAYLVTDYDRNTFGIYQTLHNADPLGNISIVSIPPPTQGNSTKNIVPHSTISSLSTPIIISIAVGATAMLALSAILVWIYIRQQHQKRIMANAGVYPEKKQIYEVDSGQLVPFSEAQEICSQERFELPGRPNGPQELDSRNISMGNKWR